MISPTIDPDTTTGPIITSPATTDQIIQSHPLIISLRQNPKFIESRPHRDLPDIQKHQSLIAGSLAGPHRISTPPYIFTNASTNRLTMILHLGTQICGHSGIIHGGLLATLFDEALARCCFAALPNKIGVTANLSVDYRAPAGADQCFVLWAEVVRVEGRKVWGRGTFETLPVGQDGVGEVYGDEVGEGGEGGLLVAEATALFIEPRDVTGLRSIYKAG
ncbi:thioesterase family protein [Aspergillus crustosus]